MSDSYLDVHLDALVSDDEAKSDHDSSESGSLCGSVAGSLGEFHQPSSESTHTQASRKRKSFPQAACQVQTVWKVNCRKHQRRHGCQFPGTVTPQAALCRYPNLQACALRTEVMAMSTRRMWLCHSTVVHRLSNLTTTRAVSLSSALRRRQRMQGHVTLGEFSELALSQKTALSASNTCRGSYAHLELYNNGRPRNYQTWRSHSRRLSARMTHG